MLKSAIALTFWASLSLGVTVGLANSSTVTHRQDSPLDRFPKIAGSQERTPPKSPLTDISVLSQRDLDGENLVAIDHRLEPRQNSASLPSGQVLAQSAVRQSLNIPYAKVKGVDPNLLSLDIYQPRDKQGLPVMVMIHGGGWRQGDKANRSMVENKVPYFVSAGYVYVSINYRLSPAVKHPVHVQDVAKALVWVHDHIAEYGGNPQQIYLMGHSAGAHLAALVATDDRYLKALGQNLTLLRGVILLDGAAYDIPRSIDELGVNASLRDLYIQSFGSSRSSWEDASPMSHVAPGKQMPPFLIFYTGNRQSGTLLAQALGDALVKAGTKAQVVQAKGKTHATLNEDIGKAGDAPTEIIMEFLQGKKTSGVSTMPRSH